MAWYYGTFSCGCDGRTNVIGPTKNRQWIADQRFSEPCQECKDKAFQEKIAAERAEAEKAAKEMELPELTGTEKQIAWAITLRQQMIDMLTECSKDVEYKGDLVLLALDHLISQYNSAEWYIEHRGNDVDRLLYLLEISMKKKKKAEEVAEVERDIKAEATVVPKNAITNVVAEIIINDNMVSVKFEKNELFQDIVKGLGYSWDGIWQKKINITTGTAAERASELGNRLLNAGFPIMIIDTEVRQNAIDGKFETECNRWVCQRNNGKYKGRFSIIWKGYNDSLYQKARSLPGSVWDKSAVVVRVEHYKEVQDFAQVMGFKFTQGALDAIEQQKQKEQSLTVVNPATVKKATDKDGLSDILNSSDEILNDLKDD